MAFAVGSNPRWRPAVILKKAQTAISLKRIIRFTLHYVHRPFSALGLFTKEVNYPTYGIKRKNEKADWEKYTRK